MLVFGPHLRGSRKPQNVLKSRGIAYLGTSFGKVILAMIKKDSERQRWRQACGSGEVMGIKNRE